LPYCAPEVLEDEALLESDIWACGVMIYELFYYNRPFKSNGETILMKNIKEKIPTDTSNPTVPLFEKN
jgi:serine/threonine protein kinase